MLPVIPGLDARVMAAEGHHISINTVLVPDVIGGGPDMDDSVMTTDSLILSGLAPTDVLDNELLQGRAVPIPVITGEDARCFAVAPNRPSQFVLKIKLLLPSKQDNIEFFKKSSPKR